MKMNIKKRMITNGLLTVAFSIILAMGIVYILIRNQNRDSAADRIDQIARVISGQLEEMTKDLVSVTSQIGNQQNWAEKVSFIQQSKNDETFESTVIEQRVELVSFLNQLTQASSIATMVMYDSEGEWICAVSLENQKAYLSYPSDREGKRMMQAIVPLGEIREVYEWEEKETSFPGSAKVKLPLPDSPSIVLESFNGLLRFEATAPVVTPEWDSETNETKGTQVGLIMSSVHLDDSFMEHMRRMAKTDINLFLGSELSVGTLREHNRLEIKEADSSGSPQIQGIDAENGQYRTLSISGRPYFEGLFPVWGRTGRIGAFSIVLSKEDTQKAIKEMLTSLVIIAFISIAVSSLLAGFLANSIIRPIKRVVASLTDIAEGDGDLTKVIDINSDNEIGELAMRFNKFVKKLQWIISDIMEDARSLTKASTDLSDFSGRMSEEANIMSNKSETVSSSADEMNFKMNSVSSIMEKASTNLNLVAGSIEEMDSTVKKIAKNSEDARAITHEAVSKTHDATVRVEELGDAAREIGNVTEAITEISEQTNLLALNATIEAARAGEAGKGFAVVANEIKELARQAAHATEEIKDKVKGIQMSTSSTIKEIEQVSIVINDVNEIVSTITSAVEEQSATTREIADNLVQTSKGIQEVNNNVAHSSAVTNEMAHEISELNQGSNSISSLSGEVNQNAMRMSKLAEKLKERVGRFKVEDKATPKEIYDLVLKAADHLERLGAEGLKAINDPEGGFVWKDSYCFVQASDSDHLIAHPFAPRESVGRDKNNIMPFAGTLAEAAKNPEGQWAEYEWPKPGEEEPSRKIAFVIQAKGYPYYVGAGIWNDDFSVEELKRMCDE